MQIGFIGTGALTSAIVTGLKSVADNSVSVVLSPRNAEIAADLARRYPGVRVARDNQAVLDDCGTVMLAVRPQVVRDVLSQLRFRPDHHVVSLIATRSGEEIAASTAPAGRVTRALPMPMVARRLGATLVCPPDPAVVAFFGGLGAVVEVEHSAEFDALGVATATFAAYFKYLDTIHGWLKDHGVADPKARDYLVALFKALAMAPETSPGPGFMHLAEEYATRGGINEQLLRKLADRQVFDIFAEGLDEVHRRMSRS